MPDAPLAPNALLRRTPEGPVAILDAIGERTTPVDDPAALVVLEAVAHHADLDAARVAALASLQRTDAERTALAGDGRFQRGRDALDAGLVLVSPRGIRVLPHGLEGHEALTLTRLSRRVGGVLPGLFGQPLPPADALEPAAFSTAVAALVDLGLLVPPPGTLDWGDLRRREPLCQVFGLGRGTPIDRHYLERFVESSRPLISGDVVDVGGDPADRVRFRLDGLSSFRVLDVADRAGVDVVADVHDAAALPEGSVDTVLLFNVLEHVRDPRTVAANVHRWLRPGGRCLVMVPNAQRLHHAAEDHWRFSATGLALVFDCFASTEPRSYGSLTTVLASFTGAAAEELTAAELAEHQADHPVATCLVATK